MTQVRRRAGIVIVGALVLSACSAKREQDNQASAMIAVTCPIKSDVISVHTFACHLRSLHHAEIRAQEPGYLEAIGVSEGEEVKAGVMMFKFRPILKGGMLDVENSEIVETQTGIVENSNRRKRGEKRDIDVTIVNEQIAAAEASQRRISDMFRLATIRAPFDGIVDRLRYQVGSVVAEGDILTSLSDNRMMYAEFDVPEFNQLGFSNDGAHQEDDQKIELILANGSRFDQLGVLCSAEGSRDDGLGGISLTAEFANLDRLLRNGQTGKVCISRTRREAIIIPRESIFPCFERLCVYVVDDHDIAHRHEIVVEDELEGEFVIKSGVEIDDMIVFEGVQDIQDGQKIEHEYHSPAEVFGSLKHRIE